MKELQQRILDLGDMVRQERWEDYQKTAPGVSVDLRKELMKLQEVMNFLAVTGMVIDMTQQYTKKVLDDKAKGIITNKEEVDKFLKDLKPSDFEKA